MKAIRSCLRALCLIASATTMHLSSTAQAQAGDIIVTSGHLDTRPESYGIQLRDASPRHFTVSASMPGLNICTYVTCRPESTVRFTLGYGGSDGPWGRATLDGSTYLVEGDYNNWATLSIEFTSVVEIPAYASTASASGTFSFRGTFKHRQPGTEWQLERLSGGGIATLFLLGNPYYPFFDRGFVLLDFATAPIPAPWQSTGVQSFDPYLTGAQPDSSFVVLSYGSDIFWGADSFQFLSQPLTGDGEIVARVREQSGTHPFAKAGLMLRATLHPSSPHVVLNVKPDGGLEFMTRMNGFEDTRFIAGGTAAPSNTWLRLRRIGSEFSAFTSADGRAWSEVGTVLLEMPSTVHAGLAAVSHMENQFNRAVFAEVTVVPATPPRLNLLVDGDFERYVPPSLGPPGWISDHPYRQTPAQVESTFPHTGKQNAACRTNTFLDCGIYQEVRAPATGIFRFNVYATADRPGGLVGADVNGVLAATGNVRQEPAQEFGEPYVMSFAAEEGDVIRVWMYSPVSPGYVLIDDASLWLDRHINVSGSWDGTAYSISGLFTVASTGPVSGTVTVSGFAGPMRLALLGYNPQGGTSTCSTQWLPQPLPPGPDMVTPTISADWDAIPPGTYCLNVVTSAAVPPWPAAYAWSGTVTYP